MSLPDPPPKDVRPRRRGRRRGPWWHGARVLGLLLVLPVVFLLAATAMLFDRDVTAPSWVVTTVEDRAGAMLGGGSLSFGDISLRVGPDLHPRIHLRDTVLSDAAGTALARIGTVDATISPRGLLFDRAALVQRVALDGTAVALTRDAAGDIKLAFNMPDSGGGLLANGVSGLVAQLDGLRDRPAFAALESLTLTGLDVTYTDARAGRVWTARGGRFGLDVDRDRTRATAALQIDGERRQTRLGLTVVSPRDSLAASLSVQVDGAEARDLASQSAALGFLAALDAPLSATLDTALDAQGILGPLNATLDIGAGAVKPAPQTAPLRFDGVQAALSYDPARQVMRFSDVIVASDWGRLQAQGQAFARDFDSGLPQALVGQFSLRDIILNPAGLFPDPITLAQADIDLRLRLDPFRLDIGQVSISDPALTLTASGDLSATPEGWTAAVDLASPALTPPDLLRLWPDGVRPGTRKWFRENLLDGTISGLTAGWRVAPGKKTQMAAGFGFVDASVRYLKHLPPITDGAGYATLSDGNFVLRLDSGAVMAPQGGALDVAGSVMQIPDVTIKNAPLVLDIATQGSVTATLAVLDLPPFEYLKKANLPVTLADGRAQVQAHVDLPLKKKVTPDEVSFDATAQLSRVRSWVLVKGRTLAASDLAVTVARSGMTVTGAASLDGVPVSGTFTRPFGAGAGPSRIAGQVTVTPQALDTFGIALPPQTVSGSGQADLEVTLAKGQAPAFTLSSALDGIGVSVPAIGWSKPRGSAGLLEVAGQLGPVPNVERLRLRAPGLSVAGAVSLTQAGQLAQARFDTATVGDWFDGPVTLKGRGKGLPVAVEVRGGRLNLAKAELGGNGAASNGSGGGQGAPISVTLEELTVAQGLTLTGFSGKFDTTGGFLGSFNGLFNGRAKIAGVVAPSRGRSAVRITAGDAGAILRAGNFLGGATGGTLDLTLLPSAQAGSFDGTLALRGLRVRDAPAIAALLDAISVVGLLQQLDGQGLAFDEVDAQFRLTPDRIVVTESSAVGPGLGISLDGIYTLADRAVDFQGVISPLYILNGIGSFLTRKGEGLIGFNFTVQGTPGNPQVGVNPLSALTPGMFRNIFRRPPPQVGN